MPLGPQLRIQETQLIQLPLPNLILMSHHLIHIPINTQIPAPGELRPGRIQPERKPARKRLRILRKRREGVDDLAPVLGGHEAGMDGEDAEVGILWIGTIFCLV